MGTKLPFCIVRGTTFYWRRRLPSPFKMSVEFSLGTKDLRVARGLSSMLTIETDRAFAVLREGKMTPEQVDRFARQKFAEHSAKLNAVHQLARDHRTPFQDELNATRAGAIAMSLLAQRGRSAQLSDFPGIADEEIGYDVARQAQSLLDIYKLDYWSDVRSRRLRSEIAETLSVTRPSPLDVAEARTATLEAYAAASAASAAQFGASPKSLDDLTVLAARLKEPPLQQTSAKEAGASPSAERPSEPDEVSADPQPSAPRAAETAAPTRHAPSETDGAAAEENILDFARRSITAAAEKNEIRQATARQKLTVIKLFVEVTGKQTFNSLKQADIKQFVDAMALLPKVRRRSNAEQDLSVGELIAKGRMNRTGSPEAVWFKLCGHGRLIQCGVVVCLGFGGRDVSDGLEQAPVVEPVDPFEGGELCCFIAAPWASSMNDLSLVETVDGLGQGVVIRVAHAAH